MNSRVDTSRLDAALRQYASLSRKDHVEILRSKAGDVCMRSAQAAKGGRSASKASIDAVWQQTEWKSKTPWVRGRDMWGLFISKLLSSEGFGISLGRRRVKNQAEADVVSARSKAGGSAGYYARGSGRWFKKIDGKWKSFKGNRSSMTSFRNVKRAGMKSADWKRVSSKIIRIRKSRVGSFVAAFSKAAAMYGKRVTRVRGGWPADVRLPTVGRLNTTFVIPIKGGKYPLRGDKSTSQQADAASKEIILSRYLQHGVNYVVKDMGDYIARKLRQRANQTGLRAA